MDHKFCVAGAPPKGESWPTLWYSWHCAGDLSDPNRVLLHKMQRRSGGRPEIGSEWVGRPASERWRVPTTLEYLDWRMSEADEAGNTARTLMLFNEPMAGPGHWWHNALGAAKRAAPVIKMAQRREPPWRVCVPNIFNLGMSTYTGSWIQLFLAGLHARNAEPDIIGLHAYQGYGAWPGLIRCIEGIRDSGDVPRDIPVWITEVGALGAGRDSEGYVLWGPADYMMRQWFGFLRDYAEELGIEASFWFVSYDADWWQYSPATCLWYPPSEQTGPRLTPTGQLWRAQCE